MHIHQQNHWNDILFYWYQSYHWYQWTIGLTNRIRLCILDMCELLIIMLHSNAWTLKAIACRGSAQLFKNKCSSGIFCIRNSAEFLRTKTGIGTGVSETRLQLWKNSQLKISVLMQRLFLLVARLVYSGKNWGHSYQIASPVSIQVQFVYLKTAELFPTLIRLLMNILRLQQLMSLS